MTKLAYTDDEQLDQIIEAESNDGWFMREFVHISGEIASIDIKPCFKCTRWHALLKLSDNFISGSSKFYSCFIGTIGFLKYKVGIVNLNICDSSGKFLKETPVGDHGEFVPFEGQDEHPGIEY
jgi:hypothetical protein